MPKRVPVGKNKNTTCGYTGPLQGKPCKNACDPLKGKTFKTNHCFEHATRKSLEESMKIGFWKHEHDIINRLLLSLNDDMRNPNNFIHDTMDVIEKTARPDVAWVNGNKMIFFEFDEHQHNNSQKQTTCDIAREKALARAYLNHNVTFVRLLAYVDGSPIGLRTIDQLPNKPILELIMMKTVKILNSVWKKSLIRKRLLTKPFQE
jgi:5-methylcytosine-specific restriction endonuclease McrBC regulatory subunit McrC